MRTDCRKCSSIGCTKSLFFQQTVLLRFYEKHVQTPFFYNPQCFQDELNSMRFVEQLQTMEEMFEKHKLDNRDIQDFRQTVDECIARQVGVASCSKFVSTPPFFRVKTHLRTTTFRFQLIKNSRTPTNFS